jgi:pyruvate dehydrogenase (quinone)/pyruvate oxidase
VKPNQLTAMLQAPRTGTPNRNHIVLQMVKDMLDDSSFEAGHGHIPSAAGRVAVKVAATFRDRADADHPG